MKNRREEIFRKALIDALSLFGDGGREEFFAAHPELMPCETGLEGLDVVPDIETGLGELVFPKLECVSAMTIEKLEKTDPFQAAIELVEKSTKIDTLPFRAFFTTHGDPFIVDKTGLFINRVAQLSTSPEDYGKATAEFIEAACNFGPIIAKALIAKAPDILTQSIKDLMERLHETEEELEKSERECRDWQHANTTPFNILKREKDEAIEALHRVEKQSQGLYEKLVAALDESGSEFGMMVGRDKEDVPLYACIAVRGESTEDVVAVLEELQREWDKPSDDFDDTLLTPEEVAQMLSAMKEIPLEEARKRVKEALASGELEYHPIADEDPIKEENPIQDKLEAVLRDLNGEFVMVVARDKENIPVYACVAMEDFSTENVVAAMKKLQKAWNQS